MLTAFESGYLENIAEALHQYRGVMDLINMGYHQSADNDLIYMQGHHDETAYGQFSGMLTDPSYAMLVETIRGLGVNVGELRAGGLGNYGRRSPEKAENVDVDHANVDTDTVNVENATINGGSESEAPGFAKGLWSVPYDDYLANLHRDEMVLTASQARDYREGNGGTTAMLVGAIQELRNDMQNLRIFVGERAFGQTVVDYSGRRMRGYLGREEDRMYSGYGWGGLSVVHME